MHQPTHYAVPPPPQDCENQSQELASEIIEAIERYCDKSGKSMSNISGELEDMRTRKDLEVADDDHLRFAILITLIMKERVNEKLSNDCIQMALEIVRLHFASMPPKSKNEIQESMELSNLLSRKLLARTESWIRSGRITIKEVRKELRSIKSFIDLDQFSYTSAYLEILYKECSCFIAENKNGKHIDLGILTAKLHLTSKTD